MSKLMLINPNHRPRKRAKVSRKRNPIATYRKRVHRSTKRRKNPIRGLRGITNTFKPAAQQAVGAIGLDLAMGYIPLPKSMSDPNMTMLAKVGIAVALGLVAEQIVKGATAANVAQGALASVLHEAARDLITQHAPSVKLGDADSPFMPMGNVIDLTADLPNGALSYDNGQAFDQGVNEYLSEYLPA